jgi:predicted RNA-binding protein with TRAM domain
MEPTEISLKKYIFYTAVDTVPQPGSKFHLADMQGFFVVHHDLKPGDKVRVTVEKVEDVQSQRDVYADNSDQDR